MSAEARRHALRLAERRARLLAPRSLIAHGLTVHQTDTGLPLSPAHHHAEWCRVLEDRERFPFVCIVAPPGYAKSTWASIAYPTWRLGTTGGRTRIGLISNTATQAEGFAQAVHAAVRTPEFAAAYPGVRLDEARGVGRTSFYVTGLPPGPNPSLLAAGVGGPILGKRFDEIVVDDPITWADARSRTVMEGVRTWFKTTLITRLPPGHRPPHGRGRIVVICTRWSEHDLVPLLEDLGFAIITMPALGYWDRELTCAECGEHRPLSPASLVTSCEACGSTIPPATVAGIDPLWPEQESQDMLLRERADDELVFELVKQGNPSVLAGEMFDTGWFRRAVPPDLSTFDSITIGVDCAGGADRTRGDYFAIVVMGTRGSEEWVLHVYRDRVPAPDQQAKIQDVHARIARHRHVDRIAIENTGDGRAVYTHLTRSTRLPLRLVTPQGDKEFRAIPLSNAYRAHRVIHASTDITGGPSRWLQPFEAEMQTFPDPSVHDDQVDAAVYAYGELTSEVPRVRALA